MTSDQPREIPCLGRSFAPGVLYDCRSDTLIPGVTLWDQEKVKKHLSIRKQPFTHCDFTLVDTHSEKSSKLGVDAHLELSLLGGLVKVEGSAHYLNDRKKSKNQVRLSFKYTSTSHVEGLTMELLADDKLQHSKVLVKSGATHVVTEVIYGADAVFVFDQDVESNEQIHEVGGKLKAEMNFLVGKISGGASVKHLESELEKHNKVSCKFYGDLLVKKSPANVADAMQTYSELPALILENTVPKRVSLYPLSKLGSNAQRLVHEISIELTKQTGDFIEELHEAEMQANDLSKACPLMFEGLRNQIKAFIKSLSTFKTNFQKQLLSILPEIRGDGKKEIILANLLEKNRKSPFSAATLQQWIGEKETEIDMLKNVLGHLHEKFKEKRVTIAETKSDVNKVLQNANLDNKKVLALVFNIDTQQDPFLATLESYLSGSENSEKEVTRASSQGEQNLRDLTKIPKSFIKLVEDNWQNEELQFLVYATESKGNGRIAQIELHEVSASKSKEFVPPSPPGKPELYFWLDDEQMLNVRADWARPVEGVQNVTGCEVAVLDVSAQFNVQAIKEAMRTGGKLTVDWSRAITVSWNRFIFWAWFRPSEHLQGLNKYYMFRFKVKHEFGESDFGAASEPFYVPDQDGLEVERVRLKEQEKEQKRRLPDRVEKRIKIEELKRERRLQERMKQGFVPPLPPGKPELKFWLDDKQMLKVRADWAKPVEGAENVIGSRFEVLDVSAQFNSQAIEEAMHTGRKLTVDWSRATTWFNQHNSITWLSLLTSQLKSLNRYYMLRVKVIHEFGETDFGEASDPFYVTDEVGLKRERDRLKREKEEQEKEQKRRLQEEEEKRSKIEELKREYL